MDRSKVGLILVLAFLLLCRVAQTQQQDNRDLSVAYETYRPVLEELAANIRERHGEEPESPAAKKALAQLLTRPFASGHI